VDRLSIGRADADRRKATQRTYCGLNILASTAAYIPRSI
jgi:hypothetical protein